MTAIYVLLSLEIVFLLLLTPIPIKVGIRFSLGRNLAFVNVFVAGIKAVKIKIEKENGVFRISKNGKRMKSNDRGNFKIDLPKALSFLRINGLVNEVVCLGFIGGEDAFDASINCSALSAFVCALFPDATSAFTYPDFGADRCDFEIKTNARISAFQMLKLVK